jgi:hypothetical protein
MVRDPKDGLGGRGKKRGLERAVVALEPEQLEKLRREAMDRMVERKVGRMDTGEVIREAVDTWSRLRATVENLEALIGEHVELTQELVEEGNYASALVVLDSTDRWVKFLDDILGGPSPARRKVLATSAALRDSITKNVGKGKRGNR